MLVVDASAVVELLLERPAATTVERHAREHALDLHAPHLLDVEVASALRRLAATGATTPDQAEAAAMDMLALPIDRYPHDILLSRCWALRENLSMYDAQYVALAEVLAPLLTLDARLARAAREHSDADVILVD